MLLALQQKKREEKRRDVADIGYAVCMAVAMSLKLQRLLKIICDGAYKIKDISAVCCQKSCIPSSSSPSFIFLLLLHLILLSPT